MLATIMNGAIGQAARRRRQISAILKTEGFQGIANRMRRVAADRLAPRTVAWNVKPADVVAADLRNPFVPPVRPVVPGQSVSINWITSPAAPGSGGHTTTFRMVDYLERNNFRNTIYFYDPFGGDHRYYADIARSHYGVSRPVRDVRDGIEDADAVIATSWSTAYAVFNARCAGKRFYFVQDFEPAFYPAGTDSFLAENTYRMGFHAITAGPWLASKLSREYGMSADFFPFGCDTRRYTYRRELRRTGVAFYARSGTPRRATELGILALHIFSERNPNVDIHIYGEKLGELPFRFHDHGRVEPSALNEIYGTCFAGLSLSMTNTSLVPHEMLAAGCIPVVNDAEHNRMVLDNPFVVYSDASPQALAEALTNVVDDPGFAERASGAAASVAQVSWDDAGAAVGSAIRRAIGA